MVWRRTAGLSSAAGGEQEFEARSGESYIESQKAGETGRTFDVNDDGASGGTMLRGVKYLVLRRGGLTVYYLGTWWAEDTKIRSPSGSARLMKCVRARTMPVPTAAGHTGDLIYHKALMRDRPCYIGDSNQRCALIHQSINQSTNRSNPPNPHLRLLKGTYRSVSNLVFMEAGGSVGYDREAGGASILSIKGPSGATI